MKAKIYDFGKRFLCFFLAFVMVLGLCPLDALAFWDGSTGGNNGSTGIKPADPNNGFMLHGTPLHGYRFTVFDEDWNKLGHSVDIHFRKETINTYRTQGDAKKSHVEYWNRYKAYGTTSLGKVHYLPWSWPDDADQLAKANASYVFFDSTLAKYEKNPSLVGQEWLTDPKAWDIANMCGASASYNDYCHIVVEPMYNARLMDAAGKANWYTMTMAEYAVYQAFAMPYGWDGEIPNAVDATTYGALMRPLSAYLGLKLYVENPEVWGLAGDDSTVGMNTIPALTSGGKQVFRDDSKGAASILFKDNNNFNTPEDVLMHPIGMGIYTGPGKYTLTIDPNGGTYKGSSEKQTFELSVAQTMELLKSDFKNPGCTVERWEISNDNCIWEGDTYTQSEDAEHIP